MNVITEKNYTTIDKIAKSVDYKDIPDIIVYKNMFNKEGVNNVTKLLNVLMKDIEQKYFTDNSYLIPGNSSPFPAFLDTLREVVEKITKVSFNSCVIERSNGSMENIITSDLLQTKEIYTYIFFGPGGSDKNDSVSKSEIVFKSKINPSNFHTIHIDDGTILIERKSVKKYWEDTISQNDFFVIKFMYVFKKEKTPKSLERRNRKETVNLDKPLSEIYLSTKKRLGLKNLILSGLSRVHENFIEGSQCLLSDGVNHLKKIIDLGSIIGNGDWGNVYSSKLISSDSNKFAIKMSRITEEDLNDPYTSSSTSWYEIWMLKDIFTHIIKNNICPNLPLFYDTFLCGNCDLHLRKTDSKYPCVITAVELASNDFRYYLESNKSIDDNILYSALFQIMAALYSIQMTGQILNNDIKAKNILCYDVTPGGYWSYKLGENTFYVPNYGKMFILNDFGVSTLYNPNFRLYSDKKKKTFNLGSRYAINMGDKFSPIEAGLEFYNNKLSKTQDIKWVDEENNTINVSHGATYRLDRKTEQVMISNTILTDDQKSYLFKKGITTNSKTWDFFTHPYHVPPFEFYNDTQDVLRMFTGGKRSTQSGNHVKFSSISESFKKSISVFMGKEPNASERTFSLYPYHVLAGNFIIKFFTTNYTTKPTGKIIAEYNLNSANSRLW